jgi:hypothetical protein
MHCCGSSPKVESASPILSHGMTSREAVQWSPGVAGTHHEMVAGLVRPSLSTHQTLPPNNPDGTAPGTTETRRASCLGKEKDADIFLLAFAAQGRFNFSAYFL